eukprot:14379583-Alexandrium_andersonii.AAC.1
MNLTTRAAAQPADCAAWCLRHLKRTRTPSGTLKTHKQAATPAAEPGSGSPLSEGEVRRDGGEGA